MGNPRLHRTSGELPVSLSSLVGRQQDIIAIREQLGRADLRLLTVTGSAGVGKTRLALAVAAALHERYDHVWLVELAGLNEPDLVSHAVASVAGVREVPDRPLLVALVDSLGAGQQLLVLDNCEHLIGPVAQMAEHLLRHCPRLTIIVTSRQRVGIQGEMLWRTSPLTVPASVYPASVEQQLTSDAVQLFAQRAAAAVPGFEITSHSASTVAHICRQLDGIPLAIELAARWVSALSLEEIASRLEDRFRLLTSDSQVVPNHQQTLRGTVEWSYGLLGQDEQVLFDRLGAFVGGCTLAAVEAVCSDQVIAGQDVIHLLARLIDASLVTRVDFRGETRYRVLETLRVFARERLMLTGQAETIYERHARYFLSLVERAEPELWGPDLAECLHRLEVEHDNLRAALRWTTGHGEAAVALGLCAALGRFWRLRGHASEGLRWLESTLSWNLGVSPSGRARALDTAGQLARDLGRYEDAERYYERSLALRLEMQDTPGAALALNNLATVVHFRGDHDRSHALLEESLTRFRQLDDERGEALTLVSLGTIAQLRHDTERAMAWYQAGLAVFRQLGDQRGVAAALNNLGNLASEQRDFDLAGACYRESLQLFRELGDGHDVAACLGNLARLARDCGDLTEAVSRCEDSLRGYAELASVHGIGSSMTLLVELTAGRRDDDWAARLLGAAAAMRETIGLGRSTAADPAYAAIRDRMGSVRFERAWDAGRSLPVEAAVAHALTPGTDRSLEGTTPLSRREHEVAVLIARGLTNRQIAETLFIAERTADTHVEHILTKLGVTSRTRVATWVLERGLAGDLSGDSLPVPRESVDTSQRTRQIRT